MRLWEKTKGFLFSTPQWLTGGLGLTCKALHPVFIAILDSGWSGNRKGALVLRKSPLGEPLLQSHLFLMFP